VLYSWEITVEEVYSGANKTTSVLLYGAPSPFIVYDNSSQIRFYCKFNKACEATLKIYDTNYSLVTEFDPKHYNPDNENQKYLDVTWNGRNGKNGTGILVASGVYIAHLKVQNVDGSSDEDTFPFAVIR